MELFPSRAIALSIGIIDVHWYGLMYALAFILGISMLPRMLRLRGMPLTKKQLDSLFFAVFLGVVIGGRLGYAIFYGGTEFLSDPLEILRVWKGGMSSHGGFIGVILALFLFARRNRIDVLLLGDAMVIPLAIGLVLGRVGNLINGELYGTMTTLPWCMHFSGVEGCRHPTQLYAILKDLFIAASCYSLLVKWGSDRSTRGKIAAAFLILYAVLRFIVEFFRDQPMGYWEFIGMKLSEGQWLTIPVFLFGIWVWLWERTNGKWKMENGK